MKTEQKRNGSLNGVVRGLRALFAAESAERLADHELIEPIPLSPRSIGIHHLDEKTVARMKILHE